LDWNKLFMGELVKLVYIDECLVIRVGGKKKCV
jgi:hypothetical protein